MLAFAFSGYSFFSLSHASWRYAKVVRGFLNQKIGMRMFHQLSYFVPRYGGKKHKSKSPPHSKSSPLPFGAGEMEDSDDEDSRIGSDSDTDAEDRVDNIVMDTFNPVGHPS